MDDEAKPAEQVKETNVDYKDAWMRARADYENFKKEMDTRRTELAAYAKAGILVDLLPVIAHFKQGLKYVPPEQEKLNWVVGIKQIQKLLTDFMERHDMKEIETIGHAFDPTKHEAVGKKAVEGKPSDQVIEEMAPGYTLGGQVIQVAKVIIAE